MPYFIRTNSSYYILFNQRMNDTLYCFFWFSYSYCKVSFWYSQIVIYQIKTNCSCADNSTFIWTFIWAFGLIDSKKKPYASFLNIHETPCRLHNSLTLWNPVPAFSTSLLLKNYPTFLAMESKENPRETILLLLLKKALLLDSSRKKFR